jgi:antitoxin component YwqK of YwqJK toxin-antitoxin module
MSKANKSSIILFLLLAWGCAGSLELNKQYYANGQLKFEWHHRNGVREGVSKVYFSNGVLMGEANFKNGKLEGLNKKFYLNGTVKEEAYFKNGNLISKKRYAKKGTLLTK